MEFNLTKIRDETPGCKNVIHFNNAGASLMPRPVLESVKNYLDLEAAIGGYEAAERLREHVEYTYEAIANLIGCEQEEIAVVENATRAWDMAFYAIPFQSGDRILTSQAEYASNYIAYLQVAQKKQVIIDVIPNDDFGQISVDVLKNKIDKRVKLITITHVPTNGGLVNPAEEVGQVAKKSNILYLLDGCQSVGQMPMSVEKIGCDMLSSTGRKYLRGPRGTGFLYVKKDLIEALEPPLLDLHAAFWAATNSYEIRKDARRFENWETNYAGKVGLGVAVDYAHNIGIEVIWQRIVLLANYFRSELSKIPGVTVRDLGKTKCGIVTFTVDGKDLHFIRDSLFKQNINVIVTSLPYTRLDMESRGLNDLIRASIHYYNTEEEIDTFCDILTSVI